MGGNEYEVYHHTLKALEDQPSMWFRSAAPMPDKAESTRGKMKDCPHCDGMGQMGKKDCPYCEGTGRIRAASSWFTGLVDGVVGLFKPREKAVAWFDDPKALAQDVNDDIQAPTSWFAGEVKDFSFETAADDREAALTAKED